MSASAPPSTRLLDFRSGGWILLLAAALALLALGLHLTVISRGGFRRAIGNGTDPATYGFDLRTLNVPAQTLVASGLPKNGIPTLSDPPQLSVAEAQAFHADLRRNQHTKFLIPTDPVVGVEIAGDARAYPLRLLASHQVVNTTIGGVPVCITYDPLCDCAVVFDRRVDGPEAPPVEFGFSGLLLNSNLVIYDRRATPAEESLWSQLLFRAIAGPAAQRGATLKRVDSRVESWQRWSRRHPQTTVMKLDVARLAIYKQTFEPYYNSDRLMFPTSPAPPEDGLPLKTRIVAWREGERWRYAPLEADAPESRPATSVIQSLWFAWYAFYPDSVRAEPP